MRSVLDFKFWVRMLLEWSCWSPGKTRHGNYTEFWKGLRVDGNTILLVGSLLKNESLCDKLKLRVRSRVRFWQNAEKSSSIAYKITFKHFYNLFDIIRLSGNRRSNHTTPVNWPDDLPHFTNLQVKVALSLKGV